MFGFVRDDVCPKSAYDSDFGVDVTFFLVDEGITKKNVSIMDADVTFLEKDVVILSVDVTNF
ncbi:MAG TPA: hypothetical protein DCE42_20195 [Myxococcales bacterium]|nr:hypothetical protein [Deltaproteobacteria bacterium]MBU49135.1 hypothetical protein [Deltaproteobacteria bacterium]HAA57097.1 hypothetical protein [Myxococcales bacterium]|tara:strand:+ start:15291 stop:15476 length:186 start_codon:yes stop_codon:yes gene_type:complete